MEEEKNNNNTTKQISYFEKKPTTCPVCAHSFNKEKMFTGSGRLNSKGIEDDLRRVYIPNKEYGLIYPLIYNITVCPKCFYAGIPETYNLLTEQDKQNVIKNEKTRKRITTKIFGELDFNNKRTLFTGAASYFLAISCYSDKKKESVLNLQKAVCALRCSWCCDDLSQIDLTKKIYWHKISDYFKFLTNRCLQKLLDELLSNEYQLNSNFFVGPDLDFNYDFEGILYLISYFGFYYKDYIKSKTDLIEKMESYSTNLSRIFGRGSYTSSKPEVFLRKSQDLYNKIKDVVDTVKTT